jgi:hypothetical protein
MHTLHILYIVHIVYILHILQILYILLILHIMHIVHILYILYILHIPFILRVLHSVCFASFVYSVYSVYALDWKLFSPMIGILSATKSLPSASFRKPKLTSRIAGKLGWNKTGRRGTGNTRRMSALLVALCQLSSNELLLLYCCHFLPILQDIKLLQNNCFRPKNEHNS